MSSISSSGSAGIPSSPGNCCLPALPRQPQSAAALPRQERIPRTAARSRQHLMPHRTVVPSLSVSWEVLYNFSISVARQ
eukprot:1319598-Pleurochrysis_carterae.AAC.1